MKRVRVLMVGALALLSVGCASVVHGSRQSIFVNSIPAGATVTARDSGGMVVATQQTPCTLRLQRGSGFFSGASYSVAVEKPGYTPANVYVSSELSLLWYGGGNCILGGLCGWLVIDPITGGMWTLHPEAINVTLAKAQSLAPREPDGRALVGETRGAIGVVTAAFADIKREPQ